MKYQAPEGCTGISVGGEQFNVDDKGQIEVPETGDYHSLLAPHGFKQVALTAEEIAAATKAAEAAAKAEAKAQAKAAADAKKAEEAAAAEAAAKAAAGTTE